MAITKADREQMVEFYHQRKTMAEIGLLFNMTGAAVRYHLVKEGVSFRHYTGFKVHRKRRMYSLCELYNLTPAQVILLYRKCRGRCMCGEKIWFSSRGGREIAQMDHDHETGRVRGFVCVSCNIRLKGLWGTATFVRKVLVHLTPSAP